MLAFAEENGLDVFSPDKAAPWLGWDAFGLSLLLGLTVCLWVAAFSALMAGGRRYPEHGRWRSAQQPRWRASCWRRFGLIRQKRGASSR